MTNFEKRPGLKFLMDHIGYRGEGCLIWPFSCCTAGYGAFSAFKKIQLAHRYMCTISHGEPPTPDHHAAHSCGNRRCINPHHLSWKTQTENQLDRTDHGTQTVIRRRKLSSAQVSQIKQLKGIETSVETAAKYGITESNVRHIQAGATWLGKQSSREFTEDEVDLIRRSNLTSRELGERYGVKHGVIWRIKRGLTYRDFPVSART